MPGKSNQVRSLVSSCTKRARLRRRRNRLFVVETLEARRLMAFDLGSFVPYVFEPSDAQTPAIIKEGRDAPAKPKFTYEAGGKQIGMNVVGDRLALDVIDPAKANPSLLAEWGLTQGRKVGDQFFVYEATAELTAKQVTSLLGSGLVERISTVFEIGASKTEAVLLNEAIVSLKPGIDAETFFTGRTDINGYRKLSGTPNQYVVTVSAGYGELALNAANALADDPSVDWASPNFYQDWQKFYIPNDPRFSNLWHLHNTGQSGGTVDVDSDLPEAWEVYPGGSAELTIAIVDDGVPTDHPDLKVWVNPGEVAGDGVDNDGNGWIDDVNGWNFVSDNNISYPNTANDMHGTAVAGVAAAIGDNEEGVAGASYNSMVLSARIFENGAAGSDAGIAEAIYYAAGRTKDGLGTWKAGDLSNHSWGGGGESDAINNALTWATSEGREGKGSLQVFSAGNFGIEVIYPATQAEFNDGMVVVGALNNFGALSEYSSFGPLVDVVTGSNDFVPGTLAIDTTDRVGANGYAADNYTGTGATGFGGTSSAAPLATGIAALAIAYGEQLGLTMSPSFVRDLLRVNTDLTPFESYDPATGKSYYTGYGLLNAGSLLNALGDREISITTSKREVSNGSVDNTYGQVFIGEFVDVEYRIRNQGTSPLSIGSVTVEPSEFAVVSGSGSSVLGPGEATTFTVRFTPTSVGSFTRTIQILSDDADESIITFDVVGIGKVPAVAGVVFEDWDGNGVLGPDDLPLVGESVYLDTNLNGSFDQSTSTFSTNVPVPISDLTTSTSNIVVAGYSGGIQDLNVRVNINHTYLSDLDLVLITPGGTRIPLAVAVGGSDDDFINTVFDDEAAASIYTGVAPFTGSFIPDSPLSVVDGSNANGTWSLEVTDFALADEGQISNWSLLFTKSEPTASTNVNGKYFFENLDNGNYQVIPIVDVGFVTTGIASYPFTITSPADSFVGVDFGVAKQNRFYGQAIEDLNGDGSKDPGEFGVPLQSLTVPNTDEYLDIFTDDTVTAIQDGGVVIASLPVSGLPSEIVDIDVRLNITHTWDDDLDVFLIAPDGTFVELFSDVGGSSDNFTNTFLDDEATISIVDGFAPFMGGFRPEQPLATLDGLNPNGVWSLLVSDDTFFDAGAILDWSLIITSNGDFVSTTDSNGRAFFDLQDGPYSIELQPTSDWTHTLPSDGVRSGIASGAPIFDQIYGLKKPLELTVDSSSVVGLEGTVLQQTGTLNSALGEGAITLTASIGSVVKNGNGTWTWSLPGVDDLAPTLVTITADDGSGSVVTVDFTYEIENASPSLTVGSASVFGNVLSLITNTGTWADVPADVVNLASSIGTIVKNGDGSWSWSYTPEQAITNQIVTITATDEDGGFTQMAFTLDALVAVVNGKVYHKGSSFAGSGVDAALDTTKSLAKSGAAAQALTFGNLINSTRGINGLVFDVAGLSGASLAASDFVFRMSPTGSFNAAANPPSSWTSAPAPSLIQVTAGTATTPARVRLEWADNAIADRWLQIQVLANANTGLQSKQTYYVGHLRGETNGAIETGSFRVRTQDVAQIAAAIGQSAGVGSILDLNKDGLVRTFDAGQAANAIGKTLTVITIPPAGSSDEGEGGFGGTLFAAPEVISPKPVGDNGGSPRSITPRLANALFHLPLPAGVVPVTNDSGVMASATIVNDDSEVESNLVCSVDEALKDWSSLI